MGMFEPRQNPASGLFAGMQAGLQRAGQTRAAKQNMAMDVADFRQKAAKDQRAQANKDRDYRFKVRKELNSLLEGATPEVWPQVATLIKQNPGVVDEQEVARMRETFKLDENLMPAAGDPFAGFDPSVNTSEYWAQADPYTALSVTGAITDIIGQMGPEHFSNPQALDQAHDQAMKVVQEAIGSSPTAGMWLNFFENKWSELVGSHQGMAKAALDQAGKLQDQTKQQQAMREDRIERVMNLFMPNLKEEIGGGIASIGQPPRTGSRIGAKQGPAYRTLNGLVASYIDRHPDWDEQKVYAAVRNDVRELIGDNPTSEPAMALQEAITRVEPEPGQEVELENGNTLRLFPDGWYEVDMTMGTGGARRKVDPNDPRIPTWGRSY